MPAASIKRRAAHLYHARSVHSARKAEQALAMSLPQLAELFTEHSLTAPFEL